MKKAGFYDPYLDTIGGGERYFLTLAEYLSQIGWDVDIFWDGKKLVEDLEKRFNLSLKKLNFISLSQNTLKKWQVMRNYDLLFWISDGSIPFLFSRKNILHFQVPFVGVHGDSRLNQWKLKKTSYVVCNSEFTKRFIDKEYKTNSKVVYPPVDVSEFKPGKKENILLSVGRFSQLLQAKRQDILITIFKKMVDGGLRGWKLVLAGGTDIGGTSYFQELKDTANDYPIEFYDSPDFLTLSKLYSKAKIFWYASGFGIDENKEPEKVEHFGITPVEAMAAGCVPILIKKGGLREIIKDEESGFFWEKEEELMKITENLINQPNLFAQLVPKMVKLSERFSRKRFIQEFDEIIG